MDLLKLWKHFYDSELELFALDLGDDLVRVRHLEDGRDPSMEECFAIFDKWNAIAGEVLGDSNVALYFDTQMLETDETNDKEECLAELTELSKVPVLKRRDGSRVYAGIVKWNIERFGPVVAKMVCSRHSYLLF